MKTRKQIETEKVNLIAENRYLYNKFIKEDTVEEPLKLTTIPLLPASILSKEKGCIQDTKIPTKKTLIGLINQDGLK
jgi:hypothetical protein